MKQSPQESVINNEAPQAITDTEIPDNPELFPWQELPELIQKLINLIKEGKSPDEFFCKCSRFPLIEMIRMTAKGHLIGGIYGFSEDLPSALTKMIYSKVCRIWNQKCC